MLTVVLVKGGRVRYTLSSSKYLLKELIKKGRERQEVRDKEKRKRSEGTREGEQKELEPIFRGQNFPQLGNHSPCFLKGF